jgi:hypothetical protein
MKVSVMRARAWASAAAPGDRGWERGGHNCKSFVEVGLDGRARGLANTSSPSAGHTACTEQSQKGGANSGSSSRDIAGAVWLSGARGGTTLREGASLFASSTILVLTRFVAVLVVLALVRRRDAAVSARACRTARACEAGSACEGKGIL